MNAKTIVLFNHKGGVSKTLTTYNLAWMLSANKGKKVLMVDCDPQCNLTGLMLGEDFDDYYTNPTTKNANIKDATKAAFDGKPQPIVAIDCWSLTSNPNLFLIPGHMDLSEYDPPLSLSMNSNNSFSTLQNLPGAFSKLIGLCCLKYSIDYVFIDVNPGLSAINEIVFVISDAFIVPTNPDPFSLMALRTLVKILPRWKKWAEQSRELFTEASYPLPNTQMKFLGEICQRFNRRNGKPTASFEKTIQDITSYISGDFVKELARYDMVFPLQNYHLADIPDFGALLQNANKKMVPVYALKDKDIPGGATLKNTTEKRDEIFKIFSDVADIILENVK
ncbi:MAG: ParA family protein [Oscillospiraceae bacterium]|jgi:cellulose biosynthesis protein BcsQ|nr:ParA family protein [Oscillospiraceae bacterium]